jgi:hypothetical protein
MSRFNGAGLEMNPVEVVLIVAALLVFAFVGGLLMDRIWPSRRRRQEGYGDTGGSPGVPGDGHGHHGGDGGFGDGGGGGD